MTPPQLAFKPFTINFISSTCTSPFFNVASVVSIVLAPSGSISAASRNSEYKRVMEVFTI